MAQREIGQARINKVLLERADLAVVTATVKGGQTRSVPARK